MARLRVAGSLALLAFSLAATTSAQEQQVGPRQRLTPEQRQAMVQKFTQARQARGTAMIQRLDRNGDGAVARDEWVRAPLMFDRLDANKDGVLGADELARARSPRGIRMMQTRIRARRALMPHMDVDKDGRISQGEWKGQPDRFARLDQNKDGVLTPDELRARFGRRPPK